MAHLRRRDRRWQVVHRDRSYGTFPTREAAETVRLDVELRDKMGGLYRAKPETFQQAAVRHLERSRRELKPNGYESRRFAYQKLDNLHSRPVSALTVSVVEDTIDRIASVAPVQAQKSLAFLKAVLKEARSRGQQVDNAVLDIRPPKHSPQRGEIMGLEEAHNVGALLTHRVLERIPAFALLTGLRQGELFNLTVGDWDRRNRRVFVREGKTEAATRWVDLCGEAHRLLVGQAWEARMVRSPWLFPRVGGTQNGKDGFGRQWRKALEAAGRPGFKFHWLRHSYITMCRRAGIPVEVIAAQVGHKDGGALIFQRYRHVQPDEAKLVGAMLDTHLATDTRRTRTPEAMEAVL